MESHFQLLIFSSNPVRYLLTLLHQLINPLYFCQAMTHIIVHNQQNGGKYYESYNNGGWAHKIMFTQQIFLTITEQKSSKDILPSLLLSAFSSIILIVSSSIFSLTCLLISRISFMSMYPLFVRSYFLKIAVIYFLLSLMYGLVPMAFMNSLKLIPPASSASNSAIISYTVFLLGANPFWVKRRVRSLGRRTPIPVESQVSKTSLRSITSSIVSCPVTQSPGWNDYKSFLLNLTLYISVFLSGRPSLFSGLYPNFSCLFFSGVRVFANDFVLSFPNMLQNDSQQIPNKQNLNPYPPYILQKYSVAFCRFPISFTDSFTISFLTHLHALCSTLITILLFIILNKRFI